MLKNEPELENEQRKGYYIKKYVLQESGMKIYTPLSGIKNAFYRQDITANNIANINTKNYKQLNVVNESLKGGGVRGKAEVSNAALTRNGNNVNLVDQVVNQINNVNQEKANVNVLRAQNEMIGNLIDIKV